MFFHKKEFAHLSNYIFGSTSAITTNVSLIVGLGSGHVNRYAILGALLTIAIADNISDSLGIHMYAEAEGHGTQYSLAATILNFLSRLFISASFMAIVLLFPMAQAATIAILWGLFWLVIISYLISRQNQENSLLEVGKHLLVAVCAIAVSRYVGYLIASHF